MTFSNITSHSDVVAEIEREEAERGRHAGSIPMRVAESAGLMTGLNKRATPGLPQSAVDFTLLQRTREQRDTAAWDALWQQLDNRTRTAVQETARELADAEQALSGARAQLADLDSRQPSKPADVPKWAGKRGEVAGMISAFETLLYGSRTAYEQAAQAALTAAQGIVMKQWREVEAQRPEIEREYRRRREEARQHLADANEDRDTVKRLHARITDGDLDLFR